MNPVASLFLLITVCLLAVNETGCTASGAVATTTEAGNDDEGVVYVAKCCQADEILVDDTCTPLSATNETKWRPDFDQGRPSSSSSSSSSGRDNKLPKVEPVYRLRVGRPGCRTNEHPWHVYHYPTGTDRLSVLTTGVLRHYFAELTSKDKVKDEFSGLDDFQDDEDDHVSIHQDYPLGKYCVDRVVLTRDRLVATYAMVCVPDAAVRWTDTNYLMRHAVDPTFHAISIASYLVVAVVYFVLPQLRDLVGNMITSMTMCLIAGQCASTVRIFTEFGSHVSFLIADTVTYVSLLAAFFWLNAFGYYVWSTFRSRNVFLRVTDGTKYCYYSSYVWGSTMCIAGTAIFAHFALETDKPTIGGTSYPAQETVGWLAISVLFTSVAFTIIVDLLFVTTTANRIKRMSTYGRIHHKMKYSFRMFVFLYAILSTGWLSLLMSRLNYDALVYGHIVVNLLQAVSVLYVCVFGQRRVTFLLGKTCNCCNPGDNIEGLDWGEEMTAINAGY